MNTALLLNGAALAVALLGAVLALRIVRRTTMTSLPTGGRPC